VITYYGGSDPYDKMTRRIVTIYQNFTDTF